MYCQKCRQPLKLDGSLEDLNPAAYDLLICEYHTKSPALTLRLTGFSTSIIFSIDLKEATSPSISASTTPRASTQVPLRQSLTECRSSHVQAQPRRPAARLRHVLHIPHRVPSWPPATAGASQAEGGPPNAGQTAPAKLQQDGEWRARNAAGG